MRADFSLLDRDPLFASLAELRTVIVEECWVGGERVYVRGESK
jgi:predicted amidohydrolase YtcJ